MSNQVRFKNFRPMHDNRLPITVFAPAIYLDLQRFMLLLLLFIFFSRFSGLLHVFIPQFQSHNNAEFPICPDPRMPHKTCGAPSLCMCVCVCGTRKKGWRQQHKTWSSYVRMSARLWPDNKRTTTTARTRWQLKAMKSLGYFQCPYCNWGVWSGGSLLHLLAALPFMSKVFTCTLCVWWGWRRNEAGG